MAKPSSLTAGLVKKGDAKPASTTSVSTVAAATPATPVVEKPASKSTAGQILYYKALTLKLDRPRFEALKKVGLTLDKSSQNLLVEALDAYLANYVSV